MPMGIPLHILMRGMLTVLYAMEKPAIRTLESWVVGTEVTVAPLRMMERTMVTMPKIQLRCQNTLPSVDSVTFSPSTVYTNDTITATAVLSDVDSSQSGVIDSQL